MCREDFISSRIGKQISFCFLIALCFITFSAQAQNDLQPLLNIGSTAPPLCIRQWLKGKPVEKFEKGKVYVIEFWATWCSPCKAAMPRLSKLARKYKNNAVFIGVDVYEQQGPHAYRKNTAQIKDFVDSMGRQMNYNVAIEDSNFMEISWLKASAEQGIPTAFIISAEGRVAWIGHPLHLHEILPRILKNDWNIDEELVKRISQRNSDERLQRLDDSLNYTLMHYNGDPKIPGDFGKPDSAIVVINELVRKEPTIKYATCMAFNTFSALLKTDPHKAYLYGKDALTISANDEPACQSIISVVDYWSDKINLPLEIYELGAEAYQVQIDLIPYPEIANMPNRYNKMANWYWRANNKSKAIEAEKKAIKAMKKSNK